MANPLTVAQLQRAFSKLGSTKTCSLGTCYKRIQIMLKEHFKKFFVIGACFFLLYPGSSLARLIMEAPIVIKLPEGSTITSIVTKIIEHGDLRDKNFIFKLVGVKDTDPDRNTYVIDENANQDLSHFNVSYIVPNSSDAGISFNDIPVLYAFTIMISMHCLIQSLKNP